VTQWNEGMSLAGEQIATGWMEPGFKQRPLSGGNRYKMDGLLNIAAYLSSAMWRSELA
jgi:hypothetical protein